MPLNFIAKASLILVRKIFYTWNQLEIVKAFKYVCKEREISSKTMSVIFSDYFFMRTDPAL